MSELFNLKAAQTELAELRQRGRTLERQITLALQARLSELGTLLYQARDTETLLTQSRRFADADEQD